MTKPAKKDKQSLTYFHDLFETVRKKICFGIHTTQVVSLLDMWLNNKNMSVIKIMNVNTN